LLIVFSAFALAQSQDEKAPLLTPAELLVQQQLQGFSTCPIISAKGYPCEVHQVATKDGWVLSMQHIAHGAKNASAPWRGVVMYQHGLLDSSAGANLNDANQNFPLILADMGYDVWLGNSRGNGQSMTHTKYKQTDAGFWDFTFDDMGEYDLPAQINYVLNATGKSTLSYIGHSQGTIQAFVGFLKPEVAAKVNVFIALAPVAYVYHTRSAIVKLMAGFSLDKIFQLFGIKEFGLPTFIQNLMPGLCKVGEPVCKAGVEAVMGPSVHMDYSRLPIYAKYFPTLTSVKNMAHWSQGVRTNKFQKYDYGSATQNMKHYNQTTPPAYDLTKIPSSLPVALFSGTNDYLADTTDVVSISSKINSISLVENSITNGYAHGDFIMGVDATQFTYPKMFALLEKYNRNV